MGYDMYLIKADKIKLNNTENEIYYKDIERATIDDVNSYYPVLNNFYQEHDELRWAYEEYNMVSEKTLTEIIEWLKNKIDTENFGLDNSEETMTKMVYARIKNWIPLKENEIIYFEEDS